MATAFDTTPYARRITAPGPIAPTSGFDPSRYAVTGPPADTAFVRRTTSPPPAPPPSSFPTRGNPSSTEVTYGFGNNQFLTDKQQQISDSVQHSFDQSLAQRDRDLQRYQMPQLSSNVEDEALARAIATANLANQKTNPYGIAGGSGGRGGGGGGFGGGGGGGGSYAAPRVAGPAAHTPWYSYLAPAMQGIAAVAPWLLGTDMLEQIRRQGVFGWLKNSDGTVTPVDQNGQPVYGAQSGWGQDVIQSNPYPNEGYYTDPSRSADVIQSSSYYGQPDFVGPPADYSVPNYGGGDIADWSNWNAPVADDYSWWAGG